MRSPRRFLLCHLLACLGLHALGSEIIKGSKAAEKKFLYMASLQDEKGHVCGGFLIDPDFVVTAAHCTGGKREPTSVVLGTHDLQKVQEVNRYDIELKCKHPSYENIKQGADIMLLKLSKKARLDKKLKVIPLPNAGMKIKDGSKCQVAGWGATRTGGGAVTQLNMVDVPVVNLQECKKQWAQVSGKFPANVICAGGYGTDKGFCQGDSGGPLVCNGKAVGVVSYNMMRNCDYPNVPNVYTNLITYLPWIKKTLKKKSCVN